MYSTEQVQELYEGLADVIDDTGNLERRAVLHTYAVPEAEMYARHGLGRRLGAMRRSIERVYEVLPPDIEGIPERGRPTRRQLISRPLS